MGLETGTNISDLVATNPVAGDPVSQGDDHLRLLKNVLKTTFPTMNVPTTAMLIGRGYGEYTSNADITAVIPADDTIPQNTEGTQIISVAYTPKSTTTRIRLRFQGQFAGSTGISVAAAVFSSASADALRASLSTPSANGYAIPVLLEHEYVPGSTSAITFTVRVGPLAAGTIRLNGNLSQRFLGGASAATLVVEEFAV